LSEQTLNHGYSANLPRDKTANAHLVAQVILHFMVSAWIFSGGFVMFEPSPYEFLFILVLPLALIARVGLHREILSLFAVILIFIPFSMIAVFQTTFFTTTEAMIYTLITIFLFLTSFFVANYVADAPYQRMRIIMKAYVATAVITASVGTLAYLKILPGEEIFTLFGRAKAFFKDPNVYGPFLALPAMFLLQKILLRKSILTLIPALLFGIIAIGVFVSFSRAAWGVLLLSSVIVFVLNFILEADGRQKVHMVILAMIGATIAIIALLGLLSVPSVNELFQERFSAVQSYDAGSTGRFGRQSLAFDMAISNPLGQGPGEFANLIIKSEPHNTYVNVFLLYGWGGGLAFLSVFFLTLKRGIGALMKRSKNRVIMIPLMATFISLLIEAAIIDTDHWRHLFLVIGLIWGVSAGYNRVSDKQMSKKNALV